MTFAPLETENLILRMLKAEDFDAHAKFLATERSKGVGGPVNRADAWRKFATDFGHWVLRGYGMVTIVEKSSGKQVGVVGFWNPEGWLEVELGWTVYDGFEGRGYAYEAANAMRKYAYETLNWKTLTSVIASDNTRSIALAKRLGAHFEQNWTSPSGKSAVIYRHPAPDYIGGDGGMEAYA